MDILNFFRFSWAALYNSVEFLDLKIFHRQYDSIFIDTEDLMTHYLLGARYIGCIDSNSIDIMTLMTHISHLHFTLCFKAKNTAF